MTDKQKYILACKFAISKLTDKGSSAVMLGIHKDRMIVDWKDVIDWLDDEYQKENDSV